MKKKDFTKPPVVFDEFGLKEVRCLCCGDLVAVRSYVEVDSREKVGEKVKVLALKQLSTWRQKRIELDGGSYVEPMLCPDCIHDKHDKIKLMDQIKRGWEIAMEHRGKSPAEIDKHKKRVQKLKIKIKQRGFYGRKLFTG